MFFPLVLLGVERMNILPGFTASTHFELVYMPWTHGLVASLGWALLAYALFRWVIVCRHRVALVVALAVTALGAYLGFAAIAQWLDRKRV